MKKLTKQIGFTAAGIIMAVMAADCQGSTKGAENMIMHVAFDENKGTTVSDSCVGGWKTGSGDLY